MIEIKESWKDQRIKEINAMGIPCDDDHPCFDEVQAIYESEAETYVEFHMEYKGLRWDARSD